MKKMSVHPNLFVGIFFFSLLCFGLLSENANAKVLYVANWGSEVSTCIKIDQPCRSISRAIALANNGDRIVVGPGRYGDLNHDGDFSDLGEEVAEVGSGCFCMIKVNKQLSFESSDGAEVTVLDAGDTDLNVVSIEASRVVFGKITKLGFTLTGAKRSGLVIADTGLERVQITNNIAIGNGVHGFHFLGNRHTLSDNIASSNAEAGFEFSGNDHALKNNLAIKNKIGFHFSGSRHFLIGNVATRNQAAGFDFAGSDFVLRNTVASANAGHGFWIRGTKHTLNTVGALSNRLAGILVETDSLNIKINRSNLFGNNYLSVNANNLNFTRCGLINNSGNSVNAINNFWGSKSGPGLDFADKICDASSGSQTSFEAFARKPFRIVTRGIKLEQQSLDAVRFFESARTHGGLSQNSALIYSLSGKLLQVLYADEASLATQSILPNGVYLVIKIYADGRRELYEFLVKR